MPTTYHVLLVGYFSLAAAIILWNVSATGHIISGSKAPKEFVTVTALGALLLIPALIVTLSAASTVYGRAIQPVAWLWPVVTVLFAVQGMLALARRLVYPLFGIPVLAYDLIITTVAMARYMSSCGIEPPHITLVISAAMADALSVVGGTAAMAQATWLLVPLFSPALPSRSRIKRLVRTVLAIGVTLATALVIVEIPGAVETIHSYDRYEHASLQERPAGDMEFGLKLFPDLRGPPPPIAIVRDLTLADSLGIDAIAVVVDPEGAHGRALDSLAHILDNLRDDSTTIIVTLGYSAHALASLQHDPAMYMEDRLADVNRLTRALRPTIFIPAYEPYAEGVRAIGIRSLTFWTDYIRRAAAITHHANPNIKVGIATASYGMRDSALYAWAAARESPVDILGFSLLPGLDGATSLDTHMRIARRWMRSYPRPKPHWIWAAGGYPIVHGERSQMLALRGVLSWATTEELIQGVVITDAGDYDAQRGLRSPDGHFRSALHEVLSAIHALRDAVVQ
jgi:hypothetical protein